MKKLITILGATLAVLLVAPSLVSAQSGNAPGNQGQAQNQNQTQTNTNRPAVSQIREQAETRAEETRTTAEQRKQEVMQQVEERRAEIKQDVCERRQQALTNVMPRLAQGATSVKQSMDTMYDRVVGFYESGQLTVDNYETLVGAIETAKANAETALATVEGQTFTLDCTDPNVGQQLDGYRLSIQEARTVLKEYKKALVDLISALKAAATNDQTANGDSQEGNQ